jgi:microcystin-dependent protein
MPELKEQYLSEIRIMSFPFAPEGWIVCSGQPLQISQYTELFSLLGTTYGGDGKTTFNLPNLQGRAPLHFGKSFALGQIGGEPTHTLSINEMPPHGHTLLGKAAAADETAAGVTPGPAVVLAEAIASQPNQKTAPVSIYATGSANTALAPSSIGMTGGQPHPNQQPYLVLNFCLSLTGAYPFRN